MRDERQTLWAYHPQVKRWLPIITGMPGQVAVEELVTRKDRVRRAKYPTRFTLLPDGAPPPPVPQ